jgi:protein-tyrosine phosphatase
VQFLRDLYTGLLAHASAELGALFTTLAQPDAMPAVFHCAVGKDRTGLVAALLLTWLGVDRQLVLDDFEASDGHIGQTQRDELVRRMADRGIGPEAAAGVLGATRESMQIALDELDSRYGGIEPFLVQHCAVDPDALARVRAMLLA